MNDTVGSFPKVTVILRGYSYEQCRCVVQHLVGTKLNAVEVAMNTPNAALTIAQLVREFGDEVHIGAGTVTTEERAVCAAEAGATFMLSPINFTHEIFDIAHQAKAMTVPAAFTPTEAVKMFDMGADIVKIFPAACAMPRFFRDIQAPLDSMPLMAVGGVNGKNVQDYFDAGAMFAGIGSGIFEKQDIISMNDSALVQQIANFENRVRW